MIDFKNKGLLKIMWLPGKKEILFDMQDEIQIPLPSKYYDFVFEHIDLEKWKLLYSEKYHDWLNKEDNAIYDINDEVNLGMINALVSVNRNLSDTIIFYWFDIDRTFNEKYSGEYCPISRRRLMYLGDGYPGINAFISPEYPIVFPKTKEEVDKKEF